ncbi:MAG: PAS domain S-box protein, partial [SAR324 cluster bacterium]|nr:PAS domain S-box protein [SAR324 cluster bacterium]
MPHPPDRRKLDARKTKDQLIAELEELRSQVSAHSNDPTPPVELDEWFQESEPQLRLLTDALPVLISYVDAKLRYRYVNHAYEEWFGHSRDWMIGRHVSEVLGETAYETLWRYLESALAGKAVTYEDTIPYRAGGTRHTHASFVPHFDENGTVLGFFVSVTDISERKKAEEALREANENLESRVEERTAELRRANEALTAQIAERERTEVELRKSENLLKRIIDEIPAALAVKDMQGRYVKINQGWRNLFNTDEKESLGKTPGQVSSLTEEQAEEIAKDDLAVVESGKPVTQLMQHLLDRNGVERIFDTRKVPLKDEDENIIGLISIGLDITESRKAELAIKDSEEKMRAVADHSPSTIILKDLEGRFLMVNRRFEEWHGVSPEAVIGKTLFDLFPREFAESMTAQEKKVLETGRMEIREYEIPTLKQGRLSVLNTKFPVRDGEGKIIGIGAITTDITERKLAEKALSASETQFQELVEGSIQGILIHRDGKALFANRACADIFGYENPEAILRLDEIFDLVHPEDRQRVVSIYEARKEGKEVPSHYDFKGIKKDGAQLWIDHIARFVSWKGEPAIQATYFDITERVEAEEKLRESEEMLRSFLDNSPSTIFLKDLEGRYLMVNRWFEKERGKSAEELLGKTAGDIFADEYATSFSNQESEVLQTGMRVEWELDVPLADGSVVRVINHKFPVYNPDGVVIGVGTIATDITERKLAEEALRSSQRLLETIFDTIPQSLFIKDINSNYLMVNRTFAERHNLVPKDFIGVHTLNGPLGTEIERRKFLEYDQIVLESGQRFEIHDYPITQPDGTVRYFSNILLPLPGPEGDMVGLVGIAEDITERKLAEEKLRESEELFRNTMENSPTIFFMKDMDGRYLMVNPQYEKWVGKSRGEMIGKTSAEIFPEEFSRLFVSQGREVIETGRPVSKELDAPNADGIRRIVCTKFPVRNAEGVPIAIGSIISDITERKQAEEKLRQSRDQLRTITDNLPVMILYIDQDERYVFMNRTAEGWFGKSSESLIGKTIEENLGGSEYKKVQPYIQQVLSGQEVRFEPQLKYADGGERTIDLLFIPDREPEGGVKGYFALGRDITEFKALEDKLRQSQKMEALGTLTGGIAHDFNNILAPILGFSEILLEKADPSTKEYSNLNSIFRSAIRAKDLISQIMLFSRPGESIKVNCDLRTVAREIVGLLHSTFPKSISIQANISKNPGNVFCDPSQIYQVLLNLCVNAEQALNEEGEITISLDRAELEALPDFTGNLLSGTFVRLAVSDNGIGMGADILPHIFDPFFTRREVGEGTGLGLSTVFGIVKTHHGGIVVTSQPGEGSTFEIFFPRVEDAPEQ